MGDCQDLDAGAFLCNLPLYPAAAATDQAKPLKTEKVRKYSLRPLDGRIGWLEMCPTVSRSTHSPFTMSLLESTVSQNPKLR